MLLSSLLDKALFLLGSPHVFCAPCAKALITHGAIITVPSTDVVVVCLCLHVTWYVKMALR